MAYTVYVYAYIVTANRVKKYSLKALLLVMAKHKAYFICTWDPCVASSASGKQFSLNKDGKLVFMLRQLK